MANAITRHIPNTITCLNLLSGCAAIILAFHSDELICGLRGEYWVYIMIGCAAVFDFLDGASARLLKAYSNIGADLDSLSDLVSFGVAPAMLMINVMHQYGDSPAAYGALIVPVCGAIRLARFNNDTSQSDTFSGLPIPSAAIFLIGLCGWIHRYGYPGTGLTVVLCVLIALAMVCRLRMFSLKFHNFSIHENIRRYALLAAAVVFIISFGIAGFAWTILFYLLMSLLGRR